MPMIKKTITRLDSKSQWLMTRIQEYKFEFERLRKDEDNDGYNSNDIVGEAETMVAEVHDMLEELNELNKQMMIEIKRIKSDSSNTSTSVYSKSKK